MSRAKIALSTAPSVDFEFREGGIDIRATITRQDFDGWIAEDLKRIGDTVQQALQSAGVVAGQIERVFLTGGSSFTPAVRHIFEERFGAGKLVSTDQFELIASGLALIGQTSDIDRWAATEF